MSIEYIDADGYPSEEALELIAKWDFMDMKKCFEFIKELWTYSNYFKEECLDDKIIYHLSTCGWSGNESIINAMQKNIMIWTLSWVQSRRGGHYIFEYKPIKE